LQQIRTFYEENFGITEEDWNVFPSKLVKVEFPKKEIILNTGKVEHHLSFIEKGIVRFYVPNDEKDLTFGFAFENSFVSAYDSFLTQTPSNYRVETVSHSILWRLTYDDLQDIYESTEIGNLIGRKASEDLFLKKSNRELSLLAGTAEENYLKLFTERPEVIRQIPLKYIASYIGITPQALSRIRRRIS
jgi:CRP-like cAMP-binding protein